MHPCANVRSPVHHVVIHTPPFIPYHRLASSLCTWPFACITIPVGGYIVRVKNCARHTAMCHATATRVRTLEAYTASMCVHTSTAGAVIFKDTFTRRAADQKADTTVMCTQ